jgi:hypothetical protein
MMQKSTTSGGITDCKNQHSSDATLSNLSATGAGLFNASNCPVEARKKALLRDNEYGYCLANCNTMALERKQIALEFFGACINPGACIGKPLLDLIGDLQTWQ